MSEKNGRKKTAEKENKMNVGDAVMFVDTGTYAKWFFGQMGIVENYTEKGSDGKAHCRVRWMQPVAYHGSFTSVSDFSADKFEVQNGRI